MATLVGLKGQDCPVVTWCHKGLDSAAATRISPQLIPDSCLLLQEHPFVGLGSSLIWQSALWAGMRNWVQSPEVWRWHMLVIPGYRGRGGSFLCLSELQVQWEILTFKKLTAEREKLVFPGDELPNSLSSTKWSVGPEIRCTQATLNRLKRSYFYIFHLFIYVYIHTNIYISNN